MKQSGRRPILRIPTSADADVYKRSIVNGLRDDDGESFYGDRASFVSEYSQHDSSGDGLKLFFKGHEKKSSKGSNASIPTRNKSLHSSGAVRPETKVVSYTRIVL